MPVDKLNATDIAAVLSANISKEARLMTDEARFYMPVGKLFADHQSVAHARDEYVRKGDVTIHTNTVEARKLECDDDEARFDERLKKLAKASPAPAEKPE